MEDDNDFEISSELLLTASRFRVERVTQTFPDGTAFTREIIQHPGAVVVLPLLEDGRVCLIRNYRIAVRQWLFELPAGTLEPNEPPIETARRELLEETGYRCDVIKPLCGFFMSPGILNERMHAFVATGLVDGQAEREPGEQISNYLATPDEVDRLLSTGQIQDAKSIAAWLYHQRFH
ncbi:MAG: NUDIX hydrolase [Pirellulaceae bacterium]|nr:NUDIX hydrolase [Pirellulaceae bacterium]